MDSIAVPVPLCIVCNYSCATMTGQALQQKPCSHKIKNPYSLGPWHKNRLTFRLVDQKNHTINNQNKATELCGNESSGVLSLTLHMSDCFQQKENQQEHGRGWGRKRVCRHVLSSWVLSSCQTSHIFSLSILSPPKRNSACCKEGQDFQNTCTLEPLNLNQSALSLLPNSINHSSEQLKAGHLLNAGPGAVG